MPPLPPLPSPFQPHSEESQWFCHRAFPLASRNAFSWALTHLACAHPLVLNSNVSSVEQHSRVPDLIQLTLLPSCFLWHCLECFLHITFICFNLFVIVLLIVCCYKLFLTVFIYFKNQEVRYCIFSDHSSTCIWYVFIKYLLKKHMWSPPLG